jgi:hypothetical protein
MSDFLSTFPPTHAEAQLKATRGNETISGPRQQEDEKGVATIILFSYPFFIREKGGSKKGFSASCCSCCSS